jgi:ABC-type lipoprotein export system ATPase subunit
MTGDVLVRCRDVSVVYRTGGEVVAALDGIGLKIHGTERLALAGRSGSGKTTLLHVLGGLVEPTSGAIEREIRRLGYVFQGGNLLPHFSAFENVAFAAHLAEGTAGRPPLQLLGLVGLAEKADNLPAELSGGEQQRVALARALAQRPELLLCDEPTGHLDSDTAERVLDLVDALQAELGFAITIATHDAGVAARFDRVLELRDGRIAREGALA